MSTSKTSSKRIRRKPSANPQAVEVVQDIEPVRQPKWGNTTKLVIGLTIIAILAWLLIRFENIVGPVLLSVVLAYLFYPTAKWLSKWSHLSWRWSVSIIFVLLLILILGLTTLGGLAIIEQAQSLIRFLDRSLVNLPKIIEDISTHPIIIGPFSFQPDFSDVNKLGQDLLGLVQPMLGQAGSLLGSVASGAANFFGWFFFTLLVAYFILAESSGGSGQLIRLNIPGFDEDFLRFGKYMGGIWNAFLRGQLIIILITIVVYCIILGAFGLRFFIGLALLAGLARFVPYVGPAVAWTSYGLVALFQGSTIFGLTPFWYVVLVVGVAWFTDIILDNLVSTRLMGNALQIHPAAVMVSALVGANLFGLVGVVLAAPVVASLKLIWAYTMNRLMDRDPWVVIGAAGPPTARPITQATTIVVERVWQRIKRLAQYMFKKITQRFKGGRSAHANGS